MQGWIELIHETAQIDPPSDQFVFLGYLEPRGGLPVWVHDEPPAADLDELFEKAGISRQVPVAPPANPGVTPRALIDHDVARGVLVSADGRVFAERDEVVMDRILQAALTPDGEPYPDDENAGTGGELPSEEGEPGQERAGEGHDPLELMDPVAPQLDRIKGSDDRDLWTGTEFPNRAYGVQILRWENLDVGYSRQGFMGSGASIGPRHILTAGHVISPNGRDFQTLGAAPAARGQSWSTERWPPEGTPNSKFPFGVRWVQWYYWPSGWDGSNRKYDYGLLILRNLCWSPGWVNFWAGSTAWLDYRPVGSVGSPALTKSCADSPDADGECGGYIYEQWGSSTGAVTTNRIYHKLDVQEGQSGAPLIMNGAIYGIHVASGGGIAYGKRLRSGSRQTICDWMSNWTNVCWSNPSGC